MAARQKGAFTMSTNLLKLTALICMLIDHIGEFIPQSPIWFRYIGRISAPLFFYCSAWGFHYTHNRKQYLIRLYLLGIGMGLGNALLSCMAGNGIALCNNIFTTLFLGCLTVFIIETAKTLKNRILYLSLFIVQQVLSFFLCLFLQDLIPAPKDLDQFMLLYDLGAVFASSVYTEGCIIFVFFFTIIYFLKERPVRLSIFTAAFSLALHALITKTYRLPISYTLVPFSKYQWLMIFVIPFFLLYNGKKGKNFKWFYYIFYPLHIWLLYLIGLSV